MTFPIATFPSFRGRWHRTVAAALVVGILVLPVVDALSVAGAPRVSVPDRGSDRGFGKPQPVTIEGYSGSAMEPFITRDNQYLLFNTSNQAPDVPDLEYATRVNDQTFAYQGEVPGANDPGFLSATPTMDDEGDFYFVSTRSYSQTLSTIYTGQFASGQVTNVHLVSGVSGETSGTVDFDVEVSADGSTLYVSVGQFDGGSAPESAHLALYDQQGSGFVADPDSSRILGAVNKATMLTYAASISTDGLELFFTRASPSGGDPAIYRAVRKSLSQPFGHVRRVAAITGFAEAPSISADGSTLYYHLLVGDQFDIESVTRPPTTSGAVKEVSRAGRRAT